MREILLIGINTDVEWQLACEAVKHSEMGQKIRLTFETPEGDMTLRVVRTHQHTTVKKERAHGKT